MDIIEFYEGELELLETPEAFKQWLYDMHEEFDLYDVSELLKYYEEIESYEICSIIRDFQKNELNE